MSAIEKLRELYKKVSNGDKETVAGIAKEVEAMQAELTNLEQAAGDMPLPEAPASATVKIVQQGTQLEYLFTIRSHNPIQLLRSLPELGRQINEAGFVAMDTYVDQRRAERGEAKGQPLPTGQPLPPIKPAPVAHAPQLLTFNCTSLGASVNDGKAYWKVKGGKFEKFGVTVWPEVLEAAGFIDLDPMQTYSLAGYVATYSAKDDGKPDKVTAINQA